MTLLEHNPNSPRVWQGELPVTNRYTFGVAGEKFFQAIKEKGRLLGTRCPQCQRTYVPAALFCERCFCELDDWIETDPVGVVDTFTILSVDECGNSLPEPKIVAFIHILDGGIVHRLAEVEIEEIYFGMPVEAVLRPPTERQGTILDILYFKPV